MIISGSPAPARSRKRLVGAFVLAALLLAQGCKNQGSDSSRTDDKGPRVLDLGGDTVNVPDSIRVATVRIDRTRSDELDPAQSNVRTGDLLRFMAQDAGAHAVAFDGDGMSAEARSFLEQSGQMRSPPFMAKGSTWVVSFDKAPPGTYPYRCPTHGVRGTITVTQR
ncbi:MAG: plastocyanin/azurin family copper-binding protein [Longimicrobiales bacterium]